MTRYERLNRRLTTSLQEVEDADRVWRRAMALDTQSEVDETTRRQLHVLWQEREQARARVEVLRLALASSSRRRRSIDVRAWVQQPR